MCIEQQGARCCRRIGLQVSFVAESLSYFGWEKFRPINCHCCQTVLELCRFNFISMCGQFYNGVGVLCVSCYEFTVGLRLHLSTHCGSAELHVASRQQTKFCDSVTYFHCHLKISLRTLFNLLYVLHNLEFFLSYDLLPAISIAGLPRLLKLFIRIKSQHYFSCR